MGGGALTDASGSFQDAPQKEKQEPTEPDVRMVLVGKTGVGKSATGNIILRRRAFNSKLSSSSLPSETQKQTEEFEGQTLAVIVTPGLFDTSKTEEQVTREITRCVSFAAPGPHVFLVVIQPNRFTDEEQKTVELIQTVFGKEAVHYIIVLFAHGDDTDEDKISVEELINDQPRLATFVKKCGGRYHVFSNKNDDPSQVRVLLKKINVMVQRNGGSYYSSEMLQDAEKAIREETEQLQKENPGLKPEDARNKAEEDNKFIRGAQMDGAVIAGTAGAAVGGTAGGVAGVVAGAKIGTAAGALAGPLGAAAGAVGGAFGGAVVGAVGGAVVGAGGGVVVGATAGVVEGIGVFAVEALAKAVKGDCFIQ